MPCLCITVEALRNGSHADLCLIDAVEQDSLPQLPLDGRVEVLYCIGCVYDLPYGFRIGQERKKCSAKTQLGRAVEYFSNTCSGFEKVSKDRRLDLDNNYYEREAIKPFVIGSKNSLFASTHDGANVTCAITPL